MNVTGQIAQNVSIAMAGVTSGAGVLTFLNELAPLIGIAITFIMAIVTCIFYYKTLQIQKREVDYNKRVELQQEITDLFLANLKLDIHQTSSIKQLSDTYTQTMDRRTHEKERRHDK